MFDYNVGDIAVFKKNHPCGSNRWKIMRIGADFRLQCQGCGHLLMIPRKQVEKSTKLLEKTIE